MSSNLLSASFVDVASVFGAALEFQSVVEYLVYIVAIVLVTMIITLWVASGRVTLRHSDHRPEEPRRRRSRNWFGRSDDKGTSDGKRRRRRSRRRRNPTLAETGGLPPIRTELPPAPSDP